LFLITSTLGQIDPSTVVWSEINTTAWMMECPDLFPLGNKWMAIASLFVTNQWFIGHMMGNPPQFIVENTGLLDFGNTYAAKSGSDFANSANSRHILFAFDGYNQPTANPLCGHSLIIPRDVTLSADQLSPRINPIPELYTLHNESSHQTWTNPVSISLPSGSFFHISTVCHITLPPIEGRIILRILGSLDGSQYTDIGFDFYTMSLFSNLGKCCNASNSIMQTTSIFSQQLDPPNLLNMTVLVDGQMIESFVNGMVVLTTLAHPDPNLGLPPERKNWFINSVASTVNCQVDYWQMLGLV